MSNLPARTPRSGRSPLEGRWLVALGCAVAAVLLAGCGSDAASSPVATDDGGRERDSSVEAAEAEAQPVETVDEWQVLYGGSSRLGYAHFRCEPVREEGRSLVRTALVTQLTLKRFGQSMTMRMEVDTLETPDGDLLELRSVLRNPPARSTTTVAQVEGETLRLELDVAGKTTTRTLPVPDDFKSPAWANRVAEREPFEEGETRTFSTFVPEIGVVAEVRMEATGTETVELPDGSQRELLRIAVTQDKVPGVVESFVDERGRERLSRTELAGTVITSHAVDEQTALEEIEGDVLDLALATTIPVGPIENPHDAERIVYRVRAEGADPADFFAEGGTQSIRRVDDETIELTVTAADAESSGEADDATEAVPDDFLAASRFLQSDDERVVEHANEAAGEADDPAAVARRMERYVRDALTTKNFSTAMASAAEVAEQLTGDCTEHAVLLAAMLRAKAIPSRIVVGYVYVPSQSAFAGHMWTEAFVDGRWLPLDATIGRGGIGAAHLAMARSSFGEDVANPIAEFLPVLHGLGKLHVEVVDVEHR